MKYTMLALSAALLVGSVSAAEDDAKKDLKKLEGKWQLAARTADGKETPADEVDKVTVVIDAEGRWKAYASEKLIFEGTVKVDPAKAPKAADWSAKVEDKTVTALAIYDVDADTLKNCFSLEKRPEKFESREGSKVTLDVYRRVKK